MVSTVLANVLASRRALLNERVAGARHRIPGLDTAAFSTFIANTLDPICVAVSEADAPATAGVIETAFDLGLELIGQGLVGPKARLSWVDLAWRQLARPAAHLLARWPLDTLGTIANAVVKLSSVQNVRVEEWIDAMSSLAQRCGQLNDLRNLGALCAWRAGMAHLRLAALARAAELDPTLAAAALGAPDTRWSELRERLLADRWWVPATGEANAQGQTVGGFTGFGGPFATPPNIRICADGFVMQSAERYFLVIADAFGAVVLPASASEFSAAGAGTSPEVRGISGGIHIQGMDIPFAMPVNQLRAVACAHGIALASPWSHYVRIVPLRS
ncbi:MAG TPA: hypothetical protein VIM98_09635 [Dyella sp.]|uniref:hypothetical protein n=1 Tax=Dyella sp. TaxID=1869338 RepID=UPI002F92B2B9